MALLRGLLVLSLSCLQGPCFTFSPVSAVDLPGQQPVSEQAQQKLPLPALFKLDNQVQSGFW
uniref:Serine (or cysteine) peptidase inhibitor, clade F, member 2 n=1 Tax=Mus musculus TaxID=10090 RepID=E9PXE0_MOUSE